MKKMMALTILALGLSAAALSRTAAADEAPPFVRIHNFTHGGTGCPGGSVGVNITADAKMLTVLYDQFVATGGTARPSDAHRQCTLVVELEFPSGWSYSLVTADYRGFAALEPGATGRQRSRYWFFGNSVALQTVLKGPFHEDYYRRDQLGVNALVWSPCGAIAPLHIQASVDVFPTSSPSSMTVDTTDLRVEQKYGLTWLKCP